MAITISILRIYLSQRLQRYARERAFAWISSPPWPRRGGKKEIEANGVGKEENQAIARVGQDNTITITLQNAIAVVENRSCKTQGNIL